MGPIYVLTEAQVMALRGLTLRMNALAYLFAGTRDISALSRDELQALFDEPANLLKATIKDVEANLPLYSVTRREDS